METSGELLGIQLFGLHKLSDKLIYYGGEFDLYSIGYFKRGTVREFLEFAGKNLARAHRKDEGIVRISVEEAEGSIHLSATEDKKVMAVCYTQGNYASRIVHRMLARIIEDFKMQHGTLCEIVPDKDPAIKFEFVGEKLKEYKKPEKVDKIAELDAKLGALKIVMHSNLQKALEQECDLADLVEKSTELSAMSKMFYRDVKEHTQKRCCVIQ